MSADLIAALDEGLAIAGEDIILRRVVGTAPNQVYVDVTCRARVTSLSEAQVAAGIPSTELNVILSPSEINAAQWPGGQVPSALDQRVPRAGPTDKIILITRDALSRAVTFSDPQFIGGDLVRINLRITG